MNQFEAKNRDEVFEIIKTQTESTFCFLLQVNKFDVANDVYDFEIS